MDESLNDEIEEPSEDIKPEEPSVENSILLTIKKMLGLTPEYEVFDQEIMVHINSVFSTLAQLGTSPGTGFRISGKEDTWESFLGSNEDLEFIKDYIYLKVKVLFDPPTSSFVLDSINNQIKELEWRINVQVDRADPYEVESPSTILSNDEVENIWNNIMYSNKRKKG